MQARSIISCVCFVSQCTNSTKLHLKKEIVHAAWVATWWPSSGLRWTWITEETILRQIAIVIMHESKNARSIISCVCIVSQCTNSTKLHLNQEGGTAHHRMCKMMATEISKFIINALSPLCESDSEASFVKRLRAAKYFQHLDTWHFWISGWSLHGPLEVRRKPREADSEF